MYKRQVNSWPLQDPWKYSVWRDGCLSLIRQLDIWRHLAPLKPKTGSQLACRPSPLRVGPLSIIILGRNTRGLQHEIWCELLSQWRNWSKNSSAYRGQSNKLSTAAVACPYLGKVTGNFLMNLFWVQHSQSKQTQQTVSISGLNISMRSAQQSNKESKAYHV